MLCITLLCLIVAQLQATAQEEQTGNSRLQYADAMVYQEANVIYWHVSHKPPSMFLHGPNRNTGFIDKILMLIQEQLKDYRHQPVQATFSRTIYDLQAGHPVCYPALVKNEEREKFIVFSQMSVMHPSNYVTLSLDLVEQMNIRKEADLRELLDNDRLVLGLEAGRSFGEQIDRTIRIHGIDTTMTFKAGKSLVELYRMLTRNRVDYLIGYPFEAYFALEALEKSDSFRSFPILGTPQFTMGAVGCANTAWGQQVIVRVNEALDSLKSTTAYQQALTSWLEDFVVNQRYEHYYLETFLNN